MQTGQAREATPTMLLNRAPQLLSPAQRAAHPTREAAELRGQLPM